MRALLHDPDAPHGLRLGEAPDPEPRPPEALIEVRATSLNFADVAFLRRRFAPGDVPGFDAAGTVRAAAEDGSGPLAGTRVATFGCVGRVGRAARGRHRRASPSCPTPSTSAPRPRSPPPA